MVEPKRAATCIIVREGGEVLLARRNDSLRFMAGTHVFPGGRIADDEPVESVIGAEDEEGASAIHAAVREAFEESGILCVRGDLPDVESIRAAQRDLLEERVAFDEILERFSLTIHAEDCVAANRWTTPATSPIRFRTQYFIYRFNGGQREHFIEGEIVGLDWMTPAEARRRWRLGEMDISGPVSHTLHQLAAVPYPEVLEIMRRPTDRKPGEPNVAEIRCGINVVPVASHTLPPATHTNCVIIGEGELYVVDPGSEDPVEFDHLVRQLEDLAELKGEVKGILLTHSHRDHHAGATALRDRFSAPIFAHAETAAQVGFSVDRHLEDGEVIESAGDPPWRIRAVHTPGHDPGHLCYLEESTGTLICGDMVANPGTIMISLDNGGDMTVFIESLQKLMELDSKLLVPAHGMSMKSPRDVLKWHYDHRLWREGKVIEGLKNGCATMEELLAQAYDDVPETTWPLARQSLTAHLARLGVSVEGERIGRLPQGA